MHARVSTYEGDAAQLREGFQAQTDPLSKVDGFEKAYFLIGEGGKAISVTMWDSKESLDASAEAANQMRDAATQPSGAQILSVDSYEVAIAVGD